MSEDVSAGRLTLEVVGDTIGLRAKLKADLDAISAQLKATIKAELVLNAEQAKADIVAATRDRVIKVKATADTTQAKADLDKAAADRTTTVKAKADTTQARTDLDALARPRTTTVKTKTDKNSVAQTVSDIGEKLTAVSVPVAIGSGIVTAVGAAGQLAGALFAVAAAGAQAAGVVGALPGLLLTAGQAAGAMTLGFSGISKAVAAYSSQQSSAGTSAVSSAQQVQAAQDSVRTSAQALANAQIDGAEQVAQAQHGVQQAAQSLADAQYNAAQSVQQALHDEQQAVVAVSDAQYNAAQSVAGALHSQQQAVTSLSDARYNAAQTAVTGEHSYTDALYSEQQAQLALTQARAAARQNLVQTSFDLRDAVIGEAQATLNLSEAKTKLQELNQSAASTQDQKTQAQLDLQTAQLQADESVNKTQQAQQAKATADKAGVDGSQQVVEAKHEETDATFSLQQAEEAVSRARVEATRSIREAEYELQQSVQQYARAQVEAVRSVQDAEYSEAQSVQGYARSKVTASESVSDATYQQQQAVQSLADTRRTTAQQAQNAEISYSEALKAAQAPTLGVASAQTALNAAMAGLSPAGRALVNLITSQVLPRYKELQKATAEAVLPGVTSGLRSALPVIGTIQTGLTGTGKVIGGVASRFGSMLGSAAGRSDLSAVMSTNTRAVGLFGDAALHVVDAIRNVTVVADPLVIKVAQWADKVAKAADSMSKTGRASGGMAAFFDRAAKSASQLLQLTGNLLGAIGHLIGGAAPAGGSLLGSLVDATGRLDKWTGSSGGQAKLQQFFTNTIPVARQFGDLLDHAFSVLGKVIKSFGGGELDGLFSVLNLALTVLSTLTKLPGFGQVVQWVLLLSSAGAGLGLVAGKIGSIGKGLTTLTKLTGLDALSKSLGLGDTVGAAAGSGLKKLGGKVIGQAAQPARIAVNGAGEAEQLEATAATGLRGAAATAGGWLAAAGQGALSMAGQVKAGVAQAGTYLASGVSAAKGFAVQFGSGMASAAGSAVSFVAGLGRQLVTGAKAFAVFVAEHTVAAGAFVAENVVMAASATAAFIAENLATLGIVSALAALIAAVVYTATHWSQVWGTIKKWAEDAWNFIYNGIGKYLLVLLGPAGLIILGIIELSRHWSQVWGDVKHWAEDAWNFIFNGIGKYLLPLLGPAGALVLGISEVAKHWSAIWGTISSVTSTANQKISGVLSGLWKGMVAGASATAHGLSVAWSKLPGIFEAPVKFVVDTVYDNGIAKVWNWVASKLSLPQLPTLKMRAGGRVPGTGSGDHVPALLEPRERVLSRPQVSAFGGGSLEAGHSVLDSLVGRGGSSGPGYSSGGIISGIGGVLGDIGGAVSTAGNVVGDIVTAGIAGTWDTAKFLAQFATDPAGALKSALEGPLKEAAKLGTSPLAKMLEAIPAQWVKSMVNQAKQFIGLTGGPGGSAPLGGATGTEMANGLELYKYLLANVFSGKKIAAAGATASIWGESTWNPFAVGTGGRGLIGWTPEGTIPDADFRGGMATQLPAIVRFIGTSGDWGAINAMKSAGSVAQAAEMWGQRVERYGIDDVHSTGVALASTFMSRDQGGPLPPGPSSLFNGTGRDEWVLTPQSVDLLGGPSAVERLNMTGSLYRSASAQQTRAAAPAAAPASGSPVVNVYPQPGMSEQHIGDVAARKLGFMLQ